VPGARLINTPLCLQTALLLRTPRCRAPQLNYEDGISMKKSISPVTAVAIVLVVVIVVVAVGYFVLAKPKSDDEVPGEGGMDPEAMEKQMNNPAAQKLRQEQEAGKRGFN